MDKRSIAVLAAAAICVMSPAGAAPAPAQEESGTVVLPALSPNDQSNECFQGYARRGWVISQGTVNDVIGSVFEVDKATWGGKFKLEVTGGPSATADLDLYMAANLGDFASDPSLNAPVFTGEFVTRGPGGEAGIVPANTTHAIVCLLPPTGVAADWSYEASAPKAKKK